MQLTTRLVVAALAAFSLVSCATYAPENRRLLVELTHARAAAVEQQTRLASLEQRLRKVEQQRELAVERARAQELRPLLERLDLLISQNRELVLHTTAPGLPPAIESEPEADPDCEQSSDPKRQLRHWAARLRADPSRWRGGLSTAENQALNLLLRRERSLDPSNPWLLR